MKLPDISDLSRDQLNELIARAKLLRGSKSGEQEIDEQLLHDVICACVGPECPKGLAQAKRTKVWPRFKQSTEIVIGYAREFKPRNLIELRAALKICIELLIDDIRNWTRPVPISYAVVVNNLNRIPAVVDAAFPGYRASGCLGFIVKAHVV